MTSTRRSVDLIDTLLCEVGAKVRVWAENLQRASRRSIPDDLEGLCLAASLKAHQLLTASGLEPEFAVSSASRQFPGAWDHVFVVAHGWLLDVTATQFNPDNAAVVVRKIPRSGFKRPVYWRYHTSFTRPGDLLRGVDNHGWYRAVDADFEEDAPEVEELKDLLSAV